MRGIKSTQHSIQGVFVFVLLGLFAVMATLLVLLGAQMYRNTVDRSELNNERRVLYSYVRSMVRAEDAVNAVSIEQKGDMKILAMRETLNGKSYVTRIYEYEGCLYELFTGAEREFEPASGTPVCEAPVFEPAIENGLLTVHMEDVRGEACDVQVSLRCPGGLAV